MSEVYSIFEEIEDEGLRARNRGVVMANIYEDNQINGSNISMSGTKAIVSYFQQIPKDERLVAREAFKNVLKERGYASLQS